MSDEKWGKSLLPEVFKEIFYQPLLKEGQAHLWEKMVDTYRRTYGGDFVASAAVGRKREFPTHPPFKPLGTVTGRFQSHTPNPPSNIGTKEERMYEINRDSPWVAREECFGIGKVYTWNDKECRFCCHRNSCAQLQGYKHHLAAIKRNLDLQAAAVKEENFSPRYCKRCGHSGGCMCPREEALVNGMTEAEAREWLIHRRGVDRGYVDRMNSFQIQKMVKEMTCTHSVIIPITRSVAREMGYDVDLYLDKTPGDNAMRACKECGYVFWIEPVSKINES